MAITRIRHVYCTDIILGLETETFAYSKYDTVTVEDDISKSIILDKDPYNKFYSILPIYILVYSWNTV